MGWGPNFRERRGSSVAATSTAGLLRKEEAEAVDDISRGFPNRSQSTRY